MPIGLSEAVYGQISNYILPHAVITVRSIQNYGDSANTSGANVTVTPGSAFNAWGWLSTGGIRRVVPLYKISLAFLPRRVEIAEAFFVMVLTGRSTNMAGPVTMEAHDVEGALASGTTALLRSTGNPWYGGGYGPAPAYDYDATVLGSTTISATDISALPAASSGAHYPVSFDVTSAVQRRRDAGEDLQLIFPVTFGSDAISNDQVLFTLAANSAAALNTYLVVRYWPALGVLGADEATSGRPPDFTKLHNPDLAGHQYRTWLDVVEQGTTSSAIKLWGWNFRRSGPRRDVVVGTSRSETTTVDNSGSVSGITLRSVDVYDTATGEGTPSGDFVAYPTDGTHYSVDYTDASGVTSTLLEETTGLSAVTLAADHVFMYASKRAIKVRTLKWSATTGANVSDRFRWSTRGDLRTTQSVDTLSLVALVPRDEANQDVADTSRARFARSAYTQQLRAAAYNQDIGGTIRGHLPVHDTTNITWPTGASAWVDLFTSGGATVIRDCKIATSYPSTDGSYPDTLRLDRELTGPEIAALTATASVTAGLYLGDFAKLQVRRIATGGAAAGATSLSLDSAFDGGTPERIAIVATSGTHEEIDVLSGSGVLTLDGALVNSYAAGTLVFLVLDPADPDDLEAMAGDPYFVEGVVPNDQDERLYSGFYQLFEQKVIG